MLPVSNAYYWKSFFEEARNYETASNICTHTRKMLRRVKEWANERGDAMWGAMRTKWAINAAFLMKNDRMYGWYLCSMWYVHDDKRDTFELIRGRATAMNVIDEKRKKKVKKIDTMIMRGRIKTFWGMVPTWSGKF